MSPRASRDNGLEDCTLEPIAVCGMACRLPGGVDSDSSFWRMLIEKRTGQTPKVPESRFNVDAHLHETLERPGSFNVAGGYFLDGNPADFDPTFFNITPIEAQWLDPQQRRILEVAYESLVSAGVTLEGISGSNTGVFVGSFTSDYQQMSIRDPDFRHNYAATGVDTGIISNRIGNIFNLRGPSFTINTACSSSIYGLHNACHALRSRDCDAAIVGGVNLIITVDQHMNTAKLGILSPTSTCHTFDASADGYGRAEGAGALYIKRLADAIRDGDPIRGVIRSTAVNTNGKVDGMGITHPSAEGQERVVRMAYEKAKLDPNLTAYAELHGTGTPVGDPIEVRAISHALNDRRPTDKPLLIGAVKPNIGHSEAASGIFAVMKAALMTEAAVIPGVALFNKINPNILEKEWNVKVHSNTAPWPKDAVVRRASVSSFGYGGTNGHVVLESVDSLYPWYQHAKAKNEAQNDRSSKRPFLVCFAAHDKATLSRNIKAIGTVASNYYLTDLAHTLNLHRTMFSHRAFTIAREGQEEEAFAAPALRSGVSSKKANRIGFLFTGQGAQWNNMGRAALQEFPTVLETIQKLDYILARVNPKPSFRMAEILLSDDESVSNRINDAEVTQPICTAIQIALVDLFTQWDVIPEVSIGHSSGEIGAAYAAGLVSAPEAIIIAYCRGRAVAENSSPGTMLAVGLGVEEVQPFLPSNSGEVCIACENSSNSVTLSGTVAAIATVHQQLTSKGIFARELKTGRAYHSPHMATVGAAYDIMLPNSLKFVNESDLLWCQPRSEMISSVTGDLIQEDLQPRYWSANLRQRVLFNTAVQQLGTDTRFSDVNLIIEVGPHSALSGPFKQICIANKLDRFTYLPSLVRNKNDADQLLCLAGALFLTGYPVDLEEVNLADEIKDTIHKPRAQRLLVDLPPYQWNYDKTYWAEPRSSAEQRGRVYPRHDLLGSRVSGLTTHAQLWRNILRHRDVPWLKDHNLGGTAIFPAAGHLSLAIEALRQVHETEGIAFEEVMLRDVDIRTALVVPDTDDGVETIFRLQKPTDGSSWFAFAVESLADGAWTVHCEGKISASHKRTLGSPPVDESALTQRVSGKRWYDAFDRVGFNYGKSFQQLKHARTDHSVNHATGEVTVLTNSGLMQGECRYLIHPSTIDACLQLIIISIHAGKHKEMPWGVVPTHIEEISLLPAGQETPQAGHAVAWTSGFEDRKFDTHAQLTGADGRLLLDIKSLTCITYDAALPAGGVLSGAESEPFSAVRWEPDLEGLDSQTFSRLWPEVSTRGGCLSKLLKLVQHRQSIESVLLCGSPSQAMLTAALEILPNNVTVTLGFDTEQALNLSEEAEGRVTVKAFPVSPSEWKSVAEGPYDLVLVENPSSQSAISESAVNLVKEKGWLVGTAIDFSPLPRSALKLGELFALRKTAAHTNGTSTEAETITILSIQGDASHQSLTEALASLAPGSNVREKSIMDFSAREDRCVVICDTANILFSSLVCDAKLFEVVQAVLTAGIPTLWVTSGVKEGKSTATTAGMAEGLLRTIRSEQAASRLVLLDVDTSENTEKVAQTVLTQLKVAATEGSSHDTEFWLHKGALHISRVYSNQLLSKATHQTQDSFLPEKVLLIGEADNGQILFDADCKVPPLSENEVSIQIHASELQTSTQGTPMLICGSVIATGSLLDTALVGKRVVAFANDELRTVVNSSTYAVIDEETSTPENLVRDLSPLLSLATIFPGQKTTTEDFYVSLPGPKYIMAAMARLANVTGKNLRVVVTSNRQREQYIADFCFLPEQVVVAEQPGSAISFIRKHSEKSSGKISIIAHDFSSLSKEVWRSIPASSQFLLIEATVNTAPDFLPFTRGASFISINSKTMRASPISAAALLEQALQLVKTYPELLNVTHSLPGSMRIVDVTDVNGVFGRPEHRTEPSVVVFRYGQSQVKTLLRSRQTRFSPEANYLLVGCLGGLGRSLTRWMIEHGARHFAFLSRSGTDKPEAARLVESIQRAGAQTQVCRIDATDESAVREFVGKLNSERPIRGAVHAAMVLKDGMFEQMSHQSFVDCVLPKAKGALVVHNALQGLSLDFFVMTSSISALLGNTGQSNYSAANSVLDALALQRNTDHLTATSLVLPMVLDVGVVAENESIETSLARKGLYGIDEQELLRGFAAAMFQPEPLIIMGMEARELAKSINSVEHANAYWYDDPRFCHIRSAIQMSQAKSTSGEANSFSSTMKEALSEGPEAVLQTIAQYIAKRMSSILMIPADDFELDGPSLGSYGLDSMIGAEMRTWLFKEFGLDYPFQKLLAPTLTFWGLARVVSEKIGCMEAAE